MDKHTEAVQSYLNQLYIKATDHDEYILHRLYSSEFLAGACITGKLLGIPNSKECFYEIRKYLPEEPNLNGIELRNLTPENAILKIAEQFLSAANDKTMTFASRYSHTAMLTGLTRAALYAEIDKMETFLKVAEELRIQISREESAEKF